MRRFDQNIYSIFGTAMHRCVQEWMEHTLYTDKSNLYATSIDMTDDFYRILVEEATPHMKQEDDAGNITFLFSRKDIIEFYEQGCHILRAIQESQKKIFPTKNVKLFAIEYELEEHIRDDIFFVGYIDVVTYNEDTGVYTLYDLKTSTRGWSDYEKSDKKKTDQLLIYKKFFSEKNNVDLDLIEVAFVILKRKVPKMDFKVPRILEFRPAQAKRSVKRAHREFIEFVEACFNGPEYNPNQEATPNQHSCKYCPFVEEKDLCAHGLTKGAKLTKQELVNLL